MNKLFAPAILGLAAFPLLAHAAAPQPHIRATVSSVSTDSLMVRTDAGQDVTIKLTPTTHYVKVLKSSLSAIDKNSYIGTATKNIGSKLIALEAVVFPNAMRGAGEGHYDWDTLPDTTLGGGTKVASTMTNGTVTTDTTTSAPMVNTTMTNGTVATDTASGGTKQLTVTYKGGTQQILVPPTAPIVTLAPGAQTDIKQGGAVVVTEAPGTDNALSVAIGIDGVKPPM